ncbi:MAG: hypothetical protein WBA16_11350 [Nonlabens sp.]
MKTQPLTTLIQLLIILFIAPGYSQVGINIENPDQSSTLDVYSKSAGVIFPRMTQAERDNIQNPATALIIFNMDEECYQYNSGTPTAPDWLCFSQSIEPTLKPKGSLNYYETRFDSRGRPTGETVTFTGSVVRSNGRVSGLTNSNTKRLGLSTSEFALKDFIVPEVNGQPMVNRLQYIGPATRVFRVSYSLTYLCHANNLTLAFYLAVGTSQHLDVTDLVEKSRVYKISTGSNDLATVTAVTSIRLSPGEHLELWGSRHSGGGNTNGSVDVMFTSYNLVID